MPDQYPNPALFIVATPIGNLGDLSSRASDILKNVSTVAAEDTRVAKKLLTHIGASGISILACHAHSGVEHVLRVLKGGRSVAYVSDAGTPGVSDPGPLLVAEARKLDIPIVPIPGPSALLTAVMASGWPVDAFTFLGFIPHKKGRMTFLQNLEMYSHPVFFFESVHRAERLLEELAKQLPNTARLFVGREMTKVFESYHEGNPTEVVEAVLGEPRKGEYVVGVWNNAR